MKENLGKMGRDKVTGFEGVITAWAKNLYGCDTYYLTPKRDKDGKLGDGCWFDEGRIEILAKGGVKPAEVRGSKPGAENLPAVHKRRL